MSYFDQLEKLNQAIGFGPERKDALVYSENEIMYSILGIGDVEMLKANAITGFVPLALITMLEVTMPAEGNTRVGILHIPPSPCSIDKLRIRIANAVFSLGLGVSECVNVDVSSKVMWKLGRKDWQDSIKSHLIL